MVGVGQNAESPGWLHLAREIRAELGGQPTRILDVGVSGALLEHGNAVDPGYKAPLRFVWQDHRVEVDCEVSASDQGFWSMDAKRWLFEIRVRFTSSNDALDAFLGAYLSQIRKAQEANVAGNLVNDVIDEVPLSDLGSARKREGRYLSFHLTPEGWQTNRTSASDQPEDGFTLSASEDEDQIRLLCLAYEESDADGRAMIREFASMTL